jgi:hypothetical protein
MQHTDVKVKIPTNEAKFRESKEKFRTSLFSDELLNQTISEAPMGVSADGNQDLDDLRNESVRAIRAALPILYLVVLLAEDTQESPDLIEVHREGKGLDTGHQRKTRLGR